MRRARPAERELRDPGRKIAGTSSRLALRCIPRWNLTWASSLVAGSRENPSPISPGTLHDPRPHQPPRGGDAKVWAFRPGCSRDAR